VLGNYVDAVRVERQSREHNRFVVSDTSHQGYSEVPHEVMQGYCLMADEAASIKLRRRFDPDTLQVMLGPKHVSHLAGMSAVVHMLFYISV
jgi:hypothetical protein